MSSRLAQLVERKTLNLVVVGSSPTVGAKFFLSIPLACYQNNGQTRNARDEASHTQK